MWDIPETSIVPTSILLLYACAHKRRETMIPNSRAPHVYNEAALQ